MENQFLDLVESFKAEDASITKLFDSRKDGVGVRTGGRRKDPRYMENLVEATEFMADIWEGKRGLHQFREAMTTSDFPLLFGDIIDRQLLANYIETPATYRNYSKIATVRDFRTVKRFALNGSEAVLSAVGQQEEYPESKLSDASYSYAVSKYGRQIPMAWETLINDDLDAFRSIPERLGRAARRTEERFATGLFVDANGPHASFYTTGNKNKIVPANGASATNPALSISGLQDGFKVLAAQVDTDSEPIYIESVELVVPPGLEITALNILNATELWLTSDAGISTQQVHVANWMKNRLRLSVNYYIPQLASSANGSTSWFLFANASVGRPALEVGFLAGHQSPETFIKAPNQMQIGGGMADPTQGDFDNDSVQYKIRHVIGGTRLDPKSTVASNGSGA